jgi:hypothetical protein
VLVREGGLIKVRGAEFLEYTTVKDNDVGLLRFVAMPRISTPQSNWARTWS